MPDLLHWSTFFTASIILLLIPGPSVMYVITRGVEHGYRGVVFSAIGLALGDLAQVCCTVVGLSAVLASSDVVFRIMKYAGATYLVGLGLHQLVARHARPPLSLAPNGRDKGRAQYFVVQGVLALNPKTAIFLLAFLPQFVATKAGPTWLQMLFFGCVFVLLGFLTNSLYGFLGGTLSAIGRQNHHFQLATRYVSAFVLIGMGITAAFVSAPAKHV
jgi:threonine/homoserine/homoserine lactone efflux protein